MHRGLRRRGQGHQPAGSTAAVPPSRDYEADLPQSDIDSRPRDLPAGDFYLDWAKAEFGEAVAEPVAKLFTRLDGGPDMGIGKKRDAYLPRPSTWVNGPGGIVPDSQALERGREGVCVRG